MRAMRGFVRGIGMLGLDLTRLGRNVLGLPRFLGTMRSYATRPGAEQFPVTLKSLRPMLTEFTSSAGVASGHYFHQDLWAARRIFERRPERHVDVGSRVDGFVAHVLVFMPVEVLDIRSLESGTRGLTFTQEDATTLARFRDGSLESISCLHAIEHFGLGRYGDPVEPNAWRRALASLERVLRPDGRLYLSVPVGVQRVEFNAHRVFAPATIIENLPGLSLVSFSAVGDDGGLHEDVAPADYASARYACGLYEFTKR